MKENVKSRPRDADATKARILAAAKAEFAASGLGGARVDVISEKAQANKRMIYHYFGSKEGLFQAVLEAAYQSLLDAEHALELYRLSPKEALLRFVGFTWSYYLDNPEFMNLVNNENLHRARHIKENPETPFLKRRPINMIQDILDRGVKSGEFRDNIDPIQLYITISAIGYHYLTNQFTSAFLFERDLMAPNALEERLSFNLDTIWRLVRADAEE